MRCSAHADSGQEAQSLADPQDTDTGQPFCAHTHGQAAAGPMDRSIRFSVSKKARRLRGFSGTIVGKFRSMPVQKNFFSAALPDALWRPASPLSSFPQGRPIHPSPVVFTLSRYAGPGDDIPLRTVLSPALPPLIKGWICPHRIQATLLPPHKKHLPMTGLSQRLLRSSSTQSPITAPNRRPRRTRAPHAPREPAAVVDSKRETPGDPRARGIRRPHAPLALTGTKVFAGMGARGKGSLFQKAALPPNDPGSANRQTSPLPPRRLRSCSPLPSGPRLGKDAANKRRWRD
ncbi:hypothetical protein DESPIG_02480 [Desulfovibrio piger ATCC 29098]|uniref:Uncharacterized protein n=1 Tax=Desulfovibrio piger ATCC 29098 TaxID=411464 RepID=B6WWL1_9BACT|nr:hypothetical protein DESPIG_02480 [Desulfovibrio piger ATCC 29098]